MKPVISGDMRVGNDTSHDGEGDFFVRKRVLSIMQPFSEKRQSRFSEDTKAAQDFLRGLSLLCGDVSLSGVEDIGPGHLHMLDRQLLRQGGIPGSQRLEDIPVLCGGGHSSGVGRDRHFAVALKLLV